MGRFGSAWLSTLLAGALGIGEVAFAQKEMMAGEALIPPPEMTLETVETAELLIFLAPGTDAKTFAQQHGLTVRYGLRSDPDAYVFVAGGTQAAKAALVTTEADNRVVAAYANERTRYVKCAFTPNDPYFHRNTPASGWPGQWHLINEHVSGRDARVQGAWNRDITGSGVTIGIVDDSFQTTHPDLALNYVAADSWDFGQGDSDPNPVHSDDEHGISVAGVAAARGNNGVGVTGAAPYASLAGLRIDFVDQTTAMFVDATQYHSYGANRNIKIKNHSYGISIPYISSSAEVAALQNSAGAGTIHCFAAGNERDYHEYYIDVDDSGGFTSDVDYAVDGDANKKHTQNGPDVICVAAFGSNGTFSSYSNWGACVFVAAPSNTSGGFGITTTDRVSEASGYNGGDDSFPDPDYTSIFGGTSSATPLAAGVMALVKQAQPNADVRFAKHLLVRTSTLVDSSDVSAFSDGGWKTNGAGFKFNQNYGFGLINADALTQQAALYSGVTALTTESTGTVSVSAAIPDNDTTGVSRTFNLSATQPLEEVLVTLNVSHTWRGDVEAYLTSPSGITSRLMHRNGADSFNGINWTFSTNAFWGEIPAGTWTLTLKDWFSGDTGTWNSYAVTARMGTLILAPQNQPPIVNVGPDQAVLLSNGASLTGTVTDDGLPNPPGTVTTLWSKASGPGTVTFGNPADVATTASFSTVGHYILRLTASDSALQASDTLVVTVAYCLSEADCDDGNLCTTDACVGGVCENNPVDCGDDFCDPATGECVECLMDEDCGDGVWCNGAEVCADGFCGVGVPPCEPDEICLEAEQECIEEVFLMGAVSRKSHGTAGELDVDLPLPISGDAGVEPRVGGPTQVLLTFSGSADGVHVQPSAGSVDAVLVAGTQATVELSDVPNAICLVLAVSGVTGLESETWVRIGVLSGDVNGDAAVNIFDLVQIRNQLNQPVTTANFRADVNADGLINIFDLVQVRNRLNTTAVCPQVDMVMIPAGEFQMGDTFNEGEADERELPVHAVRVDAFYVDRYEVTNQQYADVLNWAWRQGGHISVIEGVVYEAGSETDSAYCDTVTSSLDSQIIWDGSTFGVTAGKENHPMVKVSWYGSVAYANWRSGMEGRPMCYDLATWNCNYAAGGYRLPTEAEWEKAARGGVSGRRFPWSDQDTIQHARANYYSSSNYSYDDSPTRGYHPTFAVGDFPYTSPGGYFAPNSYGLYDMAGNVWEWCNDWYGGTYYSSSPYSNPRGPASGTHRVLRGGYWGFYAFGCRVASRSGSSPGYRYNNGGFRVVCSVGGVD
ncbi:MAG: SUMF1/EgtB/PvdO family nonheme iron enzyme [Phycisphaerae bacterium]|nr:SUMF1/EgtB/PvdO family nonheme iron enzyme [Phycisphaerae bacterium]